MGAVNNAPTVTLSSSTPTFVEGVDTETDRNVVGTAVVIDSGIIIADYDIEANEDTFAGTTLTIARSDGSSGFAANAQDVFGFASGTVTLDGTSSIKIGATEVATLTENANGKMVITFKATSKANVNAVAQAITYALDNDNPPDSVPIRFRFNDDNQSNAQGTGGSLTGDAVKKPSASPRRTTRPSPMMIRAASVATAY